MLSASEIRGSVDFGILAVRADEFTAILEHFPDRQTVQGSAFYEFAHQNSFNGSQVSVAITRCLEPGHDAAYEVTRDLIEDLEPAWIVLVGIAGGVPHDDYSLGDVLLANRIYDFAVSAEIQDGESHRREWSIAGGSVHPQVAAVLAAIPGWQDKFKTWNWQDTVGMKKPACEVPSDPNSDSLYGPMAHRMKLQASLARHFPLGKRPRPPRYAVIPVGSSNTLIKDPDLLAHWKQSARALGFVEMEAGGVYRAARRLEREFPVLVVRGLSDIVGLKRSPEWTEYACRSAAAFAAALVRLGVAVQFLGATDDRSTQQRRSQEQSGRRNPHFPASPESTYGPTTAPAEPDLERLTPTEAEPRSPCSHRMLGSTETRVQHTTVSIVIKLDFAQFDERTRKLLIHGLAGFLEVPPDHIRILSESAGSVRILIEMPSDSADALIAAFNRKDPALPRHLDPLMIESIAYEADREVALPLPAQHSLLTVLSASDSFTRARCYALLYALRVAHPLRLSLNTLLDVFSSTSLQYALVFDTNVVGPEGTRYHLGDESEFRRTMGRIVSDLEQLGLVEHAGDRVWVTEACIDALGRMQQRVLNEETLGMIRALLSEITSER